MQSDCKKIFIAGGEGLIGDHTTKYLNKEAGKNVKVMIGVTPEDMNEAKERHQHNVHELCVIKVDDAEHMKSNLKGVDTLFIIPPLKDRISFTQNHVKAAKDCGVKYLMLLSHLSADKQGLCLGEDFRKTEMIVQDCGLPFVILRCSFFMENFLKDAPEIKKNGNFRYPMSPDAQFNPICGMDVGRVAGFIMLHPDSHRNTKINLTGPAPVTMSQIAQVLSKALKRDVKFVQMGRDDAVKKYTSWGIPEREAKGLVELWEEASKGSFNATMNQGVQGPMMGFEHFVQMHMHCFQ